MHSSIQSFALALVSSYPRDCRVLPRIGFNESGNRSFYRPNRPICSPVGEPSVNASNSAPRPVLGQWDACPVADLGRGSQVRTRPNSNYSTPQGWRDHAMKVGRMITRIVLAFEAGWDGFWLARWLRARSIEAFVIHSTSVAVSREHRRGRIVSTPKCSFVCLGLEPKRGVHGFAFRSRRGNA
jgi:hypothetical protein